MKITKIEITKIKGIAHKSFDFSLLPNKPNILVAPNGFGKSSFSIGFNSLKRNKIELDDKNYHKEDDTNRPVLSLTIEDDLGNTKTLVADDNQNTISSEFDIIVINSQLAPKATKMNIGGNVIAKASLEILPTVLVSTIPQKAGFNYNFAQEKKAFGSNGKILPNIENLFRSAILLNKIVTEINLDKFAQVRISGQISSIKQKINEHQGTTEQVKKWMHDNLLTELKSIEILNNLTEIIKNFNAINLPDEIDSYLAALSFVQVYLANKANFSRALTYSTYLDQKRSYEQMIADFNTTSHLIRPKEKNNSLIVEWPKAHQISNGERDVLSFITLLIRANFLFRKQNCILIIDEIFDYLDDANLITFQYYITRLIEAMKGKGKNFFPILMTHLDPLFFNHFCFNRHKIKVFYLKDVPYQSNIHLMKLIRQREDPSIQSNVDKHYFHYDPATIDITPAFTALGILPNWGLSANFSSFISNEVRKYLNNQADYDPLAICFGVRIQIEELLYQKIADPVKKQEFLDIHGTKKKLEFCQQIGIHVPDTFYLLGIIYNDRLHWHNGSDIIRPVAIKLENLTIKKLITEIFS